MKLSLCNLLKNLDTNLHTVVGFKSLPTHTGGWLRMVTADGQFYRDDLQSQAINYWEE